MLFTVPKWAFDQQEVTCIKGGTKPKTQWYIEQNEHTLLNESAEHVSYEKPGFLKKFLELNQVMWTSNAGLVESHPYDSRPLSWPILQRGISMWSKNEKQIYLLGNPFIYWGTTWAIFSYLIVRGVLILMHQRGYSDKLGIAGRYYEDTIGFFVAGWAFHFLPFLLMGRQLFLHHYMPALYFGILGFAAVFDLLTKKFPPAKKILVTTVLITIIIAVFMVYAPITYGTNWTRADCLRSKVMDKWDYSCDTYLDSNPIKHSVPVADAAFIHQPEEKVSFVDDTDNQEVAKGEISLDNPMQPTPSAPMDEHSGEFFDEEDDDEEWYRLNRPDYPEEEEEEEDEDEDDEEEEGEEDA
jgi:dolichyl-phosphate-mannose-protein mannosyltransferase